MRHAKEVIFSEDGVSVSMEEKNKDLMHLVVESGENNSEKVATTLSSTDYWVLTGFYGGCLERSSAFGTLYLEIREPGQSFINKISINTSTGVSGTHEFKPYLIVKPNSDIRLRASANAAGKEITGGIQGALLTA